MNFRIKNEENMEMYQFYRLGKQLLDYNTNLDILLKQFSREYIISVGERYGIDLVHYLQYNLLKKADREKLEPIVSDINIKCEFPHIDVQDHELPLLYELNVAIDDTIKNKKFNHNWSTTWNVLFPKNAQFIRTMYEPLFGTNAKVLDVDENCLKELQVAMEQNRVLDLTTSYRSFLRSARTDFNTPKLQTGDYYYVNELAKIRFDSDLYVCNILRTKMKKYIQRQSKKYPRFIEDFAELTVDFQKWSDTMNMREIPDEVQLFPDKIDGGVYDTKEYKLEKLKYYLVYMVATNILSPEQWDNIRSKKEFQRTKDDKYVILNQLYQQVKGIPKKEVNEYLYSLDFKDQTRTYPILASDVIHLYECQYYLNFMITGISNFMFKYADTDHLGQYFTEKYLRTLYSRYFEAKITIPKILKHLKEDTRRKSNMQVVRSMAWNIIPKIDDYTEPDKVKKLVYQVYDHPSETLVDSIVAYIMNFLGEKDVTVDCSICDRAATGRCCDSTAYCSVECQSVDWKYHKINHI